MALYEKVQSNIKQYLSKSPSEQELNKYLQTMLSEQSPKEAFHQLDLQMVKEPISVYVHLMVQDIRENCYAYPYVIQKPFTEKSTTYYFKYGHKQAQFPSQILQNPHFFTFLQDRQTIACTPILYQTEWARSLNKNQLKDEVYQMIVDKLTMFKLGEIFSAICVYQPQSKLLHFVRKANEAEIKLWNNTEQYLSKQISMPQTRQKLLKLFSQLYSSKYSKLLTYTLLSTEHLFISASQNHSDLFRRLLPRVCEVKIQAPFKESFFPYKTEDQVLVKTKMQMTSEHTFVILDFSNFSDQKQVKIAHQQIDNLKALKVYVQEGNTIYRWIYGQSLIPHKNTGLIVKASSIINPQYVIPQGKIQKKQQNPLQISDSDLRDFRCYIHQVRRIKPTLKNDRQQIQIKIHQQPQKFNEGSLVKIMELSKLNARSLGNDQIKLQDFQHSCQLFF